MEFEAKWIRIDENDLHIGTANGETIILHGWYVDDIDMGGEPVANNVWKGIFLYDEAS